MFQVFLIRNSLTSFNWLSRIFTWPSNVSSRCVACF